MALVADYTFFDFFWSVLVFSLWVIWLWLLFTIWIDIFRRDDIGGGTKALWLAFTILVPFLGVLIYVITQNEGMTKRTMSRARKEQQQVDSYIRETAGGEGSAAAQIAQAKALLDGGVISQDEFDKLKAKALA